MNLLSWVINYISLHYYFDGYFRISEHSSQTIYLWVIMYHVLYKNLTW